MVGIYIFAGEIGNGGQAGQAPGGGTEAFGEAAKRVAEASVELGAAGGTVAHGVGLGDNADQGVKGDDNDIKHTDLGRGDQRKHVGVGDFFLHAGDAADGVEDEW